jgi:hypothetical protein
MLDPDEARAQREKANRERLQRKSKATTSQAARKAAAEGLPLTSDADEGTRRKRIRQTVPNDGEDIEDDEDTPSGLHPDDPGNFLKLCQALRLLISRRITDQQINQADELLRSYCLELIKVCFHC